MKRLKRECIQSQLKLRDVLLDRAYEEKDAGNAAKYKLYDKKSDVIRDEILNDIRKRFVEYQVDEVLETLVRFGQAPCVMYDDNGLFAVSADGMQPVVMDDERLEGCMTVIVEAHMWKPTVREALLHYLTHE